MTEQSNNSAGGTPPANSNNNNPNRNRNRRRNNNRPRDPNAPPREPGVPGQPRDPNAPAQAQGQPRPPGQPRPQNPNQNRPHNPNQPRPQGQNPNQGQGPGQGQKRRHPQHNKPRPQGEPRHNHPQPQGSGGPLNIERIYEKYLNLLDQHIIARRKYHDLFYRADPAQKNKLERNFYNTLNDIREFESKLAPDVMTLFEKRNNGYQYDRIYTTNHAIPIEGDVVPEGLPPAEPHLLQSQIAADYSDDVEESVGSAEDYLKYKGF